jgi:hypothetical protein
MATVAIWRGCCHHCHRTQEVAGTLNERGFCAFCIRRGYDALPEYHVETNTQAKIEKKYEH